MKTKQPKMIKLIKLFIILFAALTFGQEYAVEGEIHSLQEDGLHRIRIPHEVRSYAATDLSDFRIWDNKGNQVPYFVQPTKTYYSTEVSNFTEFSIISSTRKADTSAAYIFKNPFKTIDQALLLISNYQGYKNYRLEGSNDQKQWFGIVNNGQLNQLNHPTQTSVYKIINFPLCTYQYLKIVFDDRNSLPLNLLKIGRNNTEKLTTVPLTIEEIPVKAIKFQEVNKKTQIQISFNRPEVINQIRIDITSPELYSRNAIFYTLKEREIKQGKEMYRQELASFSIRSDKDLVFDIPSCKEKKVYLEIDNKDNPKLEISGIQFMQKPIYIVAALKKDSDYKVTAGNLSLSAPNYDISFVANTIKSKLPIAKISSIIYTQPSITIKKRVPFWQQSWFMWSCIGLAALIIAYFAFNLLKDLNKHK